MTDTTPADDLVKRLIQLHNFLSGESPLDGVWFGQQHPTKKGLYWWRSSHLKTIGEAVDALESELRKP